MLLLPILMESECPSQILSIKLQKYTQAKNATNFDMIVLHYCSCVAHLLRSFAGPTPFTPDMNGFTPLHYAANYGHRMSVQMVRERERTRDGGLLFAVLLDYAMGTAL